jgi:hypothetical protein
MIWGLWYLMLLLLMLLLLLLLMMMLLLLMLLMPPLSLITMAPIMSTSCYSSDALQASPSRHSAAA